LTQTFNLFGINLGRTVVRLFFRGQSLIPVSGLILFVVVAGITYLQRTRSKAIRIRYETMPEDRQKSIRWGLLLAAILLILTLPFIVGSFLSHVLFLVGLYILMGLGLNIVVGFAGLLDLGYVAFFAFGAYTMGVLTSTTEIGVSGLNFWLALPVCVVVAVFFGILLGFPVLRMRGDYLAITTLGFGEIIRILAISDWLKPYFGGAQGVLGIPSPTLGPIEFNTPQAMYYIVIFGALLAGFITIRLRDSRLGRQWMAMREDEDVAEAMGINLVTSKLMAFAIGAGFSGLSGAIFASRVGAIFPNSFGLLISVNVLSVIIVGGMGSIPGVVVGSFILVGMPELLREFAEYRLLMYGILLIVMMLTRPEGFLPAETIKRELRGDDEVDGPDQAEAVIASSVPNEAAA
jgi:branched-chain amino acid transport system permease protein